MSEQAAIPDLDGLQEAWDSFEALVQEQRISPILPPAILAGTLSCSQLPKVAMG